MKTEPIILLTELQEKSDNLIKKIREVENSSQFQKLFYAANYVGPSWQEEVFELENIIKDVKKELNL
jgi:hypothetical protein